MNQKIKTIAYQLSNLAHKQLTIKERDYLVLIIDHLFCDLELGHSCSKLSAIQIKVPLKQMMNVLERSGLVAVFNQIPDKLQLKPITLLKLAPDNLLYITKYLHYELHIAKNVSRLANSQLWHNTFNPINDNCYNKCVTILEQARINYDMPNTDQLLAIKNSIKSRINFITGGPGTGKTTTVTLLLWLIYQLYGNECIVHICAPTGKAAKRVKESILNGIDFFLERKLPFDCSTLANLLNDNNNFSTIHKLLGFMRNSIYFKYNKDNPLKADILIIDESSMVGLALFSKLLDALDYSQIKHVIFLGDRNQLSSVENGYVFASLIEGSLSGKDYDLFTSGNYYANNISQLTISKRNAGDIEILSNAILNNDLPRLESVLTSSATVTLINPSLSNILMYYLTVNEYSLKDYLDYILSTEICDYGILLDKFNKQSLLCLTNVGLLGSINLNAQIEKKIGRILKTSSLWYTGRPILILENDYSLGLFNGDIGICIVESGRTHVLFSNGKKFIPEVLPQYQLAYAISIHKSQGSEYDAVNIVLPQIVAQDELAILSRELIYTGVTRAKKVVNLFSTLPIIYQAVNKVTQRNTGLGQFLEL
ncbi:MAG: exodeoxyribonuclease V subunit alpha [Burkholderiales bacterium]|nr:exodeoxyribonuclease V subunit alpha [Burkholderiales bacterium]